MSKYNKIIIDFKKFMKDSTVNFSLDFREIKYLDNLHNLNPQMKYDHADYLLSNFIDFITEYYNFNLVINYNQELESLRIQTLNSKFIYYTYFCEEN